MIKRAVSIVIISILTVHLAGIYVFSVVRLGEIRMEQRYRLASLPADQLDVLQVPAAKFKSFWMEEREMEWQGKMYDIARVEREGETILIYCLHDEDEDNLLNFIAAVVETSRQDSQQAPGSLVQFLALEYVVSIVLLPQIKELPLPDPVANYIAFKTSAVPDPIAPPPRA